MAISEKMARMVAAESVTDYKSFLSENRRMVNVRFNHILLFSIAVGPLIALGQAAGVFYGVSYKATLGVTVMVVALAVVHRLLLKRNAAAVSASVFALFAIDAVLIVMDLVHCTVNAVWFLVPLLSLMFCDFRLYVTALVVNWLSMAFATLYMSPYFAAHVLDPLGTKLTPGQYFASRFGGLTLEMIVMGAVGYALGRMAFGYYKGMLEKTAAQNAERQAQERLSGELMSMANIYISAYEIDIANDSFNPIVCNKAAIAEAVGNNREHAQQVLYDIMKLRTDPVSQADIHAFIDLSSLDERLKFRKTITLEFLNAERQWRRGRFVASRRAVDGRLSRVLWLVEDINIEKRGRDALIDMSQRAMAASEAKSAFLSNMSHEIRTPINAVLGMNEMILRECDDLSIIGYAESIKAAGGTLLGLVNDILDFSKIESGKMEIIPVEYDVASLVNDLVNMIQPRADAKGLELALGFDPALPRMLKGDEVRVKQVITNILTNAVKYTERGSVTFTIGCEKLPDAPETVVLNVAVTDTGIGIKEEDMKKLFAEFYRIEEKRNRNIEGTGLGMSIAQSLLGMMGSSLTASSVYGKGSTFSFSLKQNVVDWAPMGDYETLRRERLKGRRRYNARFTAASAIVLVVDDNPMNLKVFQSLLKQTRVRIDLANDGDECLRYAGEKKYDMIFLDHMMPGKDGIETLQELRRQKSNPNLHTPTICLTANAISGAREQYMAAGFDDYLTKPIDSARLEEMLAAYLPPEKIEAEAPAADADAPALESVIPEALAALRGSQIDVAVGLKNSGSAEAYLPLLQIFHDSLDETAATIDRFYAEEDIKSYTIKVHALKSSARIIGATQFGEEAQKLEDAGKREDFSYIRAHHAGFMETYRRFKAPLAAVLAPGDAPAATKPEADAALLEEAYAEIRAAAEDMDGDRLDGVFQEMADYRVPAGEEELWDGLKDAAAHYDYDAVAKLMDGAGKAMT